MESGSLVKILVVVVLYAGFSRLLITQKLHLPKVQQSNSAPSPRSSTTPTISWSAGKSQDGRRRLKVRSSPQYEVVSELESEGAFGGVLFLFSFTFTLFYV